MLNSTEVLLQAGASVSLQFVELDVPSSHKMPALPTKPTEGNMNRLPRLFAITMLVTTNVLATPSAAAEMTFQLINDSERALNFKLFSRGETHQQWPSKSKAYSINPDAAVQQVKITCEAGEQICWGAWMKVQSVSGEIRGANGERETRTSTHSTGAGERGQRSCEHCCHVCTDGVVVPATKLRDPSPGAR